MRRIQRFAAFASAAQGGDDGSRTTFYDARRRKGTGDSKKQFGFGSPLGKQAQFKQGGTSVPKRIANTTKVQYTNKKGRTYTFSIPVSQITHPQSKLVSPIDGKWKELDTSYCDTGDLEEDMPFEYESEDVAMVVVEEKRARSRNDKNGKEERDTSSAAEAMRVASETRAIAHAFTSLCSEYVLMDTNGLKTTLTYSELNSGPSYEHNDRKVKRRRHWLSIRHRFEEVKEIIWADVEEEEEGISSRSGKGDSVDAKDDRESSLLSVEEMYAALRWADAANDFSIRKMMPYDVADKRDFEPLDLQREVRIFAYHVAGNPTAFFTGDLAAQEEDADASASDQLARKDRYVTCMALAQKHGVSPSAFVRRSSSSSSSSDSDSASLGHGRTILLSLPQSVSRRSASEILRIMWLISSSNDSTAVMFSDPTSGLITDNDVLDRLRLLMAVETFGAPDALAAVDGNDLIIYLQFLLMVRKQNAAFFSSNSSGNQAESDRQHANAFAKVFEYFLQLGLSRCRYILYQKNGVQTSVMSEDEYIPFVDIQRHTEKSHPDMIVHNKLGARSGQGLRAVKLDGQQSAALAELLVELQDATPETHLRGETLLNDLIHHIGLLASASKASLAIEDIIRVLPIVATAIRTSTQPDAAASRLERIFSVVGSTIGSTIQNAKSSEAVVQLVEGLSACRFIPTSFQRVEMVLLRHMAEKKSTALQAKRAAVALAELQPGAVSQLVLHNIALCTAPAVASGELSAIDTVELLEALAAGGYTQLDPFLLSIPNRHEALLSKLKSNTTNPSKMLVLGNLLASCAVATEAQNVDLSHEISHEARLVLLQYVAATVANGGEHSLHAVCLCLTRFAVVWPEEGSATLSEDTSASVCHAALSAYISKFNNSNNSISVSAVAHSEKPASPKDCAAGLESLVRLDLVAQARESGLLQTLQETLLHRFLSAHSTPQAKSASDRTAATTSNPSSSESLTPPVQSVLRPGSTLSRPLISGGVGSGGLCARLVEESTTITTAARSRSTRGADRSACLAAAEHVLRCNEHVSAELSTAAAQLVASEVAFLTATTSSSSNNDNSSESDGSMWDGNQSRAHETPVSHSFELTHLQRKRNEEMLASSMAMYYKLLEHAGQLKHLENAIAQFNA